MISKPLLISIFLFAYILFPFTSSGEEIDKRINFIVANNFETKAENRKISKEFNQALLQIADYFELNLPLESIAVIPAYNCKKGAKGTVLSNVLCYSKNYYPIERVFGLDKYQNHLKYYLLSKHLIYKNIHSRWFGLQAGQVKNQGRLLKEDFIAGAALLVQDIVSQKIYPDENVINNTACATKDLSNLYYLFLSQQYKKNPAAILEYIKYLFGGKYDAKKTESFFINLNSKWKQFRSICKSNFDKTQLSNDDFFIKNYWPYDMNIFEENINIQSLSISPTPKIRVLKIVNKSHKKQVKNASKKFVDSYKINENESVLIKKTKKLNKTFLRDKGKKNNKIDIVLNEEPTKKTMIRDISYSSFSNTLAALTSQKIHKLEMTGPRQLWLNYESSKFDISDILTISKFSLNDQILVTVANYKNSKRSALLWDVINDSVAPILNTTYDTYSPKWTSDNKGIFFLAKKAGVYRAYHLDLISQRYNILLETKIPLTTIVGSTLDQVEVVAINKKGAFITKLDVSKPIKHHKRLGTYNTTNHNTIKPISSKDLFFESSEEPSKQVWTFKISPFIFSEAKGFLAGLTFDANRFDNQGNINGSLGYDLSAKDVELDLTLDLYNMLLTGRRYVDPLLSKSNWRDTGEVEFSHNLNVTDMLKLNLAAKFLTITSDNISNQRHNLLGPSLKLNYTTDNLLSSQIDYSLLFITSDETKIMHNITWNIILAKQFPRIEINISTKGQVTFKDKQGLLWPIAGGQLSPIYQRRQLMLRGFAKTSFYEPYIGTFNIELPFTVYKHVPPPVTGAIWSDLNQFNLGFLWWDIKLVPVADVIVSSMRNFNKRWSWSGGGELRIALRNSFLSIYAFSGAYYANSPKNDWTYNFGGGFTW